MAGVESLLFASIPFALFLALITEILTQLRWLTRTGVALSWLGFAIVCLVWMRRAKRSVGTEPALDEQTSPLDWMERIALAAIAVLLALTALTALTSAPNTWDAMMYHLPRVVEWINNRGVQFFPTVDRFQLDQAPFAEYGMLHLCLLWGSDRLVGLVQWFGYGGCIVAVSLIAKELGGSRRSQIVAAVLCATIPTAVLEASGTKTELVATYWIALAVYLMLVWRKNQSWAIALAIGDNAWAGGVHQRHLLRIFAMYCSGLRGDVEWSGNAAVCVPAAGNCSDWNSGLRSPVGPQLSVRRVPPGAAIF